MNADPDGLSASLGISRNGPANAADAFHISTRDWTVADMAKTMSVIITDDLDGSSGAETATFSFGGQNYEIDLSAANLARLEESLRPFMDAGRRTARSKPSRTARANGDRIDRSAVRAWAAEQGLQVSERGRISAEVMSKYEAAH